MSEFALSPRLLAHEEGLFVFDKPAGVSMDQAPEGETSFIGWLDSDERFRGVRPIHRLDKPTSGLVMAARDVEIRAMVSAFLANGAAKKTYLAVVHGLTRDKGVIKRRLKDGRRGKGLQAVTRYWTVGRSERWSLVRVVIETGRKHQIRRHFEGLGHPVVGDRRYRGRTGKKRIEGIARMALHSWLIELPDGKAWCAPPGPSFKALLDRCGLPQSTEGLRRGELAKE